MDTTTRQLRTSGELHYPGRVDPPAGTLMGPDTHDRLWEVTGAVYDTSTNTTTVHADVVEPPQET